eukprot:m.147513 g.147513  ORF g.147513 m.147513 type:complete len:339 (+) comp16115_c0_seq4:1678-2694(+)
MKRLSCMFRSYLVCFEAPFFGFRVLYKILCGLIMDLDFSLTVIKLMRTLLDRLEENSKLMKEEAINKEQDESGNAVQPTGSQAADGGATRTLLAWASSTVGGIAKQTAKSPASPQLQNGSMTQPPAGKPSHEEASSAVQRTPPLGHSDEEAFDAEEEDEWHDCVEKPASRLEILPNLKDEDGGSDWGDDWEDMDDIESDIQEAKPTKTLSKQSTRPTTATSTSTVGRSGLVPSQPASSVGTRHDTADEWGDADGWGDEDDDFDVEDEDEQEKFPRAHSNPVTAATQARATSGGDKTSDQARQQREQERQERLKAREAKTSSGAMKLTRKKGLGASKVD